MSTETKYYCDVCRMGIKEDAFVKGDAFPLRFAVNNKIEVKAPWRDMPVHLCLSCVTAIAEFDAGRVKR